MTHAPRSLVAAIDQGTTSSRCILFDHAGRPVASHQLEHRQITPRPGWVEHDPDEIIERVRTCVRIALREAGTDAGALAAVGISNQRETTVVWDRRTGRPVYPAIVWQDTRTADAVARLAAAEGGADRFRARTGLPISTYSSALKLRWILDHIDGGRDGLAFGTINSWVLWQLTGGVDGGVHATDVTNASRTMLMGLETLDWDASILDELGIPRSMLPEIRGSSEVYGTGVGDLDGVPISGILGDQHAALFGQTCFEAGQSKCTYGTGAFMLMHTGTTPVHSTHGLITTVAARLGGPGTPATYALEGSVAVAGSLVQWLRDDLAIIDSADEVEALARSVPDSGDVVFVPAFSGLFAPHWRPDARGVIAGLTRFSTKAHVARAALGGDGVSGRRSRGCDGGGPRGATPRRAAGGRWDDPERAADADPGGHPGECRGRAGHHRDQCPGRGLCRRSRSRVLAGPRRTAVDGFGAASMGAADVRT